MYEVMEQKRASIEKYRNVDHIRIKNYRAALVEEWPQSAKSRRSPIPSLNITTTWATNYLSCIV
jgi:hypothetical protein